MFVYQNAAREICVTFKATRPVANPEYVISIDNKENKITINGEVVKPVEEKIEEPTPVSEEPTNEPAEPEVADAGEEDEGEQVEEDETEE